MSNTIDIALEDAEVTSALLRLIGAARDLTPAMRGIAGILQSSADQAFQDQASPAGVKWAPLSPITIAMRAVHGHGPQPILRVAGNLARIQSDYGRDYARAGSPMIYAGTHQFGARKGQYGRTSRGAPIPWGDIPARPFLGIDEVARADILDILTAHLSSAS